MLENFSFVTDQFEMRYTLLPEISLSRVSTGNSRGTSPRDLVLKRKSDEKPLQPWPFLA